MYTTTDKWVYLIGIAKQKEGIKMQIYFIFKCLFSKKFYKVHKSAKAWQSDMKIHLKKMRKRKLQIAISKENVYFCFKSNILELFSLKHNDTEEEKQ